MVIRLLKDTDAVRNSGQYAVSCNLYRESSVCWQLREKKESTTVMQHLVAPTIFFESMPLLFKKNTPQYLFLPARSYWEVLILHFAS